MLNNAGRAHLEGFRTLEGVARAKAEIINGLADGEEVIVGPYRTLKNMHAGDAVKVEDEKADQGEDDEEESGSVEVSVD